MSVSAISSVIIAHVTSNGARRSLSRRQNPPSARRSLPRHARGSDSPLRLGVTSSTRESNARLGCRSRVAVCASSSEDGADVAGNARTEAGSARGADGEVEESPEESLECVLVGTDVACVLSEDEGDPLDGAKETRDDDSTSSILAALGGVALVSPFFLWGTSMVAMKEVLPATSPLFVASVRLVPAGAVLVAWAASKGRPMPSGGMAWLAIAIFALVDGTAFQGCLAEGLQRTSAGLGSVIIDSQPLTVAVLAAIIYGESLAPAGVFGLFLGIVGLLMLELPKEALAQIGGGDLGGALAAVTAGVDDGGGIWDSGEWWMLLAAQSMAVGTVMVRWVCKYVDPVMATGWHMALGGVPLLAYSIATEPGVYENLDKLTAGDVGGLMYTSLLGSALAYGAFFYFASKGSLTKLSSLTFLTPMFAALFGYLLLGETLDEIQLAGAAVTIVGIYLVNTRASEGQEEKEA